MNWQQLASHFGNEPSNIRKFRQTVRDAWEHQVSGRGSDSAVFGSHGRTKTAGL
jgi:hypothetical protein